MNYRVDAITDLNNNPKTDPIATSRLGRIVQFDEPVAIGKPLFMECVFPGFLKSMITTPVEYSVSDGRDLVVVTKNSKYYLIMVED